MALVLEIDHLLGVSFAAQGPDSSAPDWPPQPDRVFSALVAAWAARGGLAEERAALEWLETLAPPLIQASDAAMRPAPEVFVPPNDARSGRSGDITLLPERRRRQPRRFPAALPEDPVVRLVWAEEPDEDTLTGLRRLARDVGYVGHSASMTRCDFQIGPVPEGASASRRRVYSGRCAELESAFARGKRPSRGAFVAGQRVPAESAAARSAFSTDWLVLTIASGAADPRAAPRLSKAIVRALNCHWQGDRPAELIGHDPDGAKTTVPHLAVAPLLNVGFPHSDGALMGFALIPPAGSALLTSQGFVGAIRRWRASGFELAEGALKLKLAIAEEDGRVSLQPWRYAKASTKWASVTPMVLDRHLKRDGAERMKEAEEQIKRACVAVGLPSPSLAVPDKHSMLTGAVSAAPSGKGPSWARWAVPQAFASRALVHAALEFKEPVAGPLLLGAGRHCGLGLFLPLPDDDEAQP
jgi:CRISPR-associated protein Csb2